eukprot:5030322-Amphidinium_carterae.1
MSILQALVSDNHVWASSTPPKKDGRIELVVGSRCVIGSEVLRPHKLGPKNTPQKIDNQKNRWNKWSKNGEK